MTINKQQIKGLAEQATGKAKEVLGKAMGNTKLETKGNIQKNIGSVKTAIEDALSDISKAAKSN